MRDRLVTKEDMNFFRDSRDVIHYSQRQFSESLFLPIGKWFSRIFEDHISKCDLVHYKGSKTMCLALEHFQVQLIPCNSGKKDLDTCPIWICMRCGICKKRHTYTRIKQNRSQNLW